MLAPARRFAAAVAAPIFTVVVAASSCGKSEATAPAQQTPTQNPPTIATVVIQATSTAPLTTGVTAVLIASAKDATGGALAGYTFTWKSSDATVATVTSTGAVSATLTAIAPGSATITATTGSAIGTTFVTISKPIVPAAVVIRPDSVSYEENAQGVFGSPAQLTATLLDSLGNATTGIVTWISSDTSAATVSSTGVVTPNPAVTASSFVTITATSSGVSGTSTVVVNPQVGSVTVSPSTTTIVAGQTTIIKATARDTRGNILAGVTLDWVNDNAKIVRLVRYGDSVSVIGLIPGFATITAGDLVSATVNASAGITVTGSTSVAIKRPAP